MQNINDDIKNTKELCLFVVSNSGVVIKTDKSTYQLAIDPKKKALILNNQDKLLKDTCKLIFNAIQYALVKNIEDISLTDFNFIHDGIDELDNLKLFTVVLSERGDIYVNDKNEINKIYASVDKQAELYTLANKIIDRLKNLLKVYE